MKQPVVSSHQIENCVNVMTVLSAIGDMYVVGIVTDALLMIINSNPTDLQDSLRMGSLCKMTASRNIRWDNAFFITEGNCTRLYIRRLASSHTCKRFHRVLYCSRLPCTNHKRQCNGTEQKDLRQVFGWNHRKATVGWNWRHRD